MAQNTIRQVRWICRRHHSRVVEMTAVARSSSEAESSEERTIALSGPITGGAHGFPGTSTSVDLASRGYAETEYFMEGIATSYRADGTWASDGEWAVSPDATAPYVTRLLVRKPEDPSVFNGTVLVEWLNVTGNVDVDVDFGYMHEELTRGGYVWVGVSAQAAGIHSTSGSGLGESVCGLKAWDPERYGALHHPGDAYSYDIFTQAGAALRDPQGADPLDGLAVKQVFAAGESQSGIRMSTYANAIQPVANVYDGLIVHARAGFSAPLGDGMGMPGTDLPGQPEMPRPTMLRTDLEVPVFQLLTETEIFELGGGPGPSSFAAARQPDTDKIRTWEIAGTAHSDVHSLRILYLQYTKQFGTIKNLQAVFPIINDGPQRYVVSAALRSLKAWAADSSAPGKGVPLETAQDAIVRDQRGNALGGVRTPHVDVPVATLTGEMAQVPLNGATVPFDAATLAALYPSHDAYVSAFTESANRAVDDGFLLPEDGAALIAAAQASDIGR